VVSKPNISDRLAGKGRSFVAAAIQPLTPTAQQQQDTEQSQKDKNPEPLKTQPTKTRDQTVNQLPRKRRSDQPKPALVVAWFQIRPDQITLLEEIKLEARKRGEKPPSKYVLAVEAFDLLARKYDLK
jgi:hypothetical protein